MSKKLSARESARLEAERIAAKQSSGDNRTRNLLIAAIVVVILALVGVGYFLVKESQKTVLSDFEGPTPTVSDLSGGIPFGGPDALPGVINENAMKVDVYADFLCPGCAAFDSIHSEDIRALITSGDATINYHPVNILDGTESLTGYSTMSANAFVEVVENEPELALDFMEELFAKQPGAQGYSYEEIGEIAASVGVSEATIEKFSAGTYVEWVATARVQATRDGMRGTPSLRFDGKFEDIDWGKAGTVLERVNG